MVFKAKFNTAHMCCYNTQIVICMCTRNPEASVTQRCMLLPLQSYNCTKISDTPPLIAMAPRLPSPVLIDGCHARFPGRLLAIAPSLGSLLVVVTANKQRSEALGLHRCVYNTLPVEHRRRVGLRRISPPLAFWPGSPISTRYRL